MACSVECLLILAGTITTTSCSSILTTGKYPNSSAIMAKGGAALAGSGCGSGCWEDSRRVAAPMTTWWRRKSCREDS